MKHRSPAAASASASPRGGGCSSGGVHSARHRRGGGVEPVVMLYKVLHWSDPNQRLHSTSSPTAAGSLFLLHLLHRPPRGGHRGGRARLVPLPRRRRGQLPLLVPELVKDCTTLKGGSKDSGRVQSFRTGDQTASRTRMATPDC